LCHTEELPTPPASVPVSGAGSVSRKKGLSGQQTTASCSKEQRHSKQQAANCSEQSEDEVTAETSLLPRQNEQPDGIKVSTFLNVMEIITITYKSPNFHSSNSDSEDGSSIFLQNTGIHLQD